MYSIGEFSKIGKVSKKMLRHYDQIGLLHPEKVNKNGYRYYSHNQVNKILKINQLKAMNFSLSEIKHLFENDDFYENQLKGQLIKLQREKALLQKSIQLIEKEISAYPVNRSLFKKELYEIKHDFIEQMSCITKRWLGPLSLLNQNIEACYMLAKENHLEVTGPCMLRYFDEDFNIDHADVELCLPVQDKDLKLAKTLQSNHVVYTKHKGSYDLIGEAYAALYDYFRENNLSYKMPFHELYLLGPTDTENPEAYETLIYFVIDL